MNYFIDELIMRLRKNRVPFESFLQKGTIRISVSTHLKKKNRNSSFKTFILQLHSLLCTCTKKVQCENVMLLLENKKVLNLFFEKHRHPLATSLSLVPNCQRAVISMVIATAASLSALQLGK